MKLLKKILFLFFILLSFGAVCFGQGDSNGGYNSPIMDNSISFKAYLDGEKVVTSWTKFTKEPLKYYKVSRSTTNSNPVYPNDGYIFYSSDVNVLSHIDYKPVSGTAYYRVCAITTYNNRYCSNVVKIYKEGKTYDEGKTSNGYTTINDTIEFKASLEGGKVYTKWSAYDGDHQFKYYKVIRSNVTESPVYPDHGYITAISNVYTTSYTDTKPLYGKAWYRVCAITEGNYRYCSNVVKIVSECSDYAYDGSCEDGTKDEDKTDYTYDNAIKLTSSIKSQLNNIIETFIKKLEAKYSSDEDRAEYIDKIIVKLEILGEEKPKMINVVNYLIDLLENKQTSYEGLSDVEDIFDI